MSKAIIWYGLALAMVSGFTVLPVAYASPLVAQVRMNVSPATQITHEIRVNTVTAGNGYDTGTTLAIGMINSTVPFTSLNLKWDRAINPAVSGVAREAYVVNSATGKKIPVSFEVQSHDRMVDAGNDSVNVILDGGGRLTQYSYGVVLTHGETLYAGAYPVGVLADVVIA
ncbi:hypothetical protein ET423_18390 [Salmonella enterica]|nr:hypothetical protein [Salmonella enterica]EAV0977048.1 hypothetical protein [Salmonella enterica]EBL9938816.1 hypothetical protein [Salmonella enterica]EGI8540352.1 hypothetical protein [Salmonella enterica]EHZ1525585.1 hypothetical protein [Salmonella enterica]